MAPVAQYSQLRTGRSWPGVNVSMRQDEKVSPDVNADKWSIHWNKLELSFSPVTGYQFLVCSWQCPRDDSLHQAVGSALKLLRWRKAIIPSSPVEVAWCGPLFFILRYMGTLNLLLLLTDWPIARTITLALWCKFGAAWKVQTHQDTYRWVMLRR